MQKTTRSVRRAVAPGDRTVWYDLRGVTADGRPVTGPAFAEDRVRVCLHPPAPEQPGGPVVHAGHADPAIGEGHVP